MKILFINSVYKNGSTGNIIYDLKQHAEKLGHQTLVIYGRGKKKRDAIRIQCKISFLINVLFSRLTGRMWNGFGKKQTKKIIKLIEDFKPDIINIHQLYGFYCNPYLLIKYLKKANIKTYITLHDFTIFTGKCGSPLKCLKYKNKCGSCPRKQEYPKSYFIDRTKAEFELKIECFKNANNINFIAVSRWLYEMAKLSPIINSLSIYNIDNGIDISNYTYNSEITKSNYVLTVSSNFSDEIKGKSLLISILDLAWKKRSELQFILIGKNSDYISKHSCNKNVLSLGKMKKTEIISWYQKSKCFFLPSQQETFSLATIESLCCGTPVIGPNDCGAPTSLLKDELCNFSTPRKPDLLLKEIEKMCSRNLECSVYSCLSKKTQRLYDKNTMCNKYMRLFEGKN